MFCLWVCLLAVATSSIIIAFPSGWAVQRETLKLSPELYRAYIRVIKYIQLTDNKVLTLNEQLKKVADPTGMWPICLVSSQWLKCFWTKYKLQRWMSNNFEALSYYTFRWASPPPPQICFRELIIFHSWGPSLREKENC